MRLMFSFIGILLKSNPFSFY